MVEMDDWKIYTKSHRKNLKLLESKKPDIVEVINEKFRLDKEEERKRTELTKNGEWCYHGESGEWYWSGAGEPDCGDCVEYDTYTSEEQKEFREAEHKTFLEQMKKNATEKRKLKEKINKEAMNNPIQPLPERDLCEYEKLREKNIKEREEAMAACQFFEDMNDYKKEIGFHKESSNGCKKKHAKKFKQKKTQQKAKKGKVINEESKHENEDKEENEVENGKRKGNIKLATDKTEENGPIQD